MKLKQGDIVKKDLTSVNSWHIQEKEGKLMAVPNITKRTTDFTEFEMTEENENTVVRLANVIGLDFTKSGRHWPEEADLVFVTPELIEQSKKWEESMRKHEFEVVFGTSDKEEIKKNFELVGESKNRKGLSEREMNSPYKDLYKRCRELDKTLKTSELTIVYGAYPELVTAFFAHFKKEEGTIGVMRPAQNEFNKEMDNYMNKDKYFTPDIEDIRVGYECEAQPVNTNFPIQKGKLKWEMSYIGEVKVGNMKGFWRLNNILIDSTSQLRVPYLTTEQIEAEGWVKQNNNITEDQRAGFMPDYRLETEFGALRLYINDIKNPSKGISIEKYVKGNPNDVWSLSSKQFVFTGQCKDINTFRYICKLLNIN